MKNYIFNKDIFNQISFIFQFILQNYEEGKIKSKTNSPVTNKNKEQPILKEYLHLIQFLIIMKKKILKK